MRKQNIAITLSAATLLLSGCTVGPKYKRPTIDTPTVYRGAEASGNTQTSETPHDMDGNALPGQANAPASAALSLGDEKWWEVFGDPQLQDLIRTALKQNYDVRIAAERVMEVAGAARRHALAAVSYAQRRAADTPRSAIPRRSSAGWAHSLPISASSACPHRGTSTSGASIAMQPRRHGRSCWPASGRSAR